jgi:trans-2,3-dihydro-3-hydroxyanthranilate isomerase
MPDKLVYRAVDAFAERPYQGNPAGVVLEADDLDDNQLQRIAQEVNLSETAFVSRLSDLHRPPVLRWFTPTTEVGFCGHATLAAAEALRETGYGERTLSRDEPYIRFDCAAGSLTLVPEWLNPPHDRAPLWWLDMPAPDVRVDNTNPIKTCELLSLSESDLDPALPPMRTRDDDLIYFITSWQRLTELEPHFTDLDYWCRRNRIRGICVATTATLTPSIHVHSRFFAPAAGVPEDPVTGSVHGPLATLLVINGYVGTAKGHAAVTCMQGRPGERVGIVRALVRTTGNQYKVKIGGQCHCTVTGEITPPPVR